MATHNIHKYDDMKQEGGTGIMIFDTIVGQVSEYVPDRIGLRRWFWINLKGNSGHFCRILCAYQPCGKCLTLSGDIITVYAHQKSYFGARGENTFIENILERK